jgi:hypothetical protein
VLVVNPDYLPDSNVFFICAWTPFPNGGGGGGGGGDFPPQLSPGGSRGVTMTIFVAPPPGGGFGGSAPEAKFWEKLPCKIL